MAAQGIAEYPLECCGLLLGNRAEERIEKIRAMPNASGENRRESHFLIEPFAMYGAEQEAEKEGWEILGFYHSHPDMPAMLSKEDEAYMIPGLAYAVLSVGAEGLKDLQVYWKNRMAEKPSIKTIRFVTIQNPADVSF